MAAALAMQEFLKQGPSAKGNSRKSKRNIFEKQ